MVLCSWGGEWVEGGWQGRESGLKYILLAKSSPYYASYFILLRVMVIVDCVFYVLHNTAQYTYELQHR